MVDRAAVLSRLRRRRFPWTVLRWLAAFGVLSIGLTSAAVALQDASDCVGTWPSCPAGPLEAALLLAFFVYAPGLLGLAAVLGVAELFGPRLQLFRSVVALAAAAGAVVMALVLAVEAVA